MTRPGDQHHSGDQSRTRRRTALWWTLCLIPLLAAFVVQWLPAINGPHLWFGLPSVLWWTCLPGSALVSVILLIVERSRTDRDEQQALDDEAAKLADTSDPGEPS